MNTFLGFIRGGGVMMYPLIIFSIALIAIVIERAVVLRRAAVDGDALLDDVRNAYGRVIPGKRRPMRLSSRAKRSGRRSPACSCAV